MYLKSFAFFQILELKYLNNSSIAYEKNGAIGPLSLSALAFSSLLCISCAVFTCLPVMAVESFTSPSMLPPIIRAGNPVSCAALLPGGFFITISAFSFIRTGVIRAKNQETSFHVVTARLTSLTACLCFIVASFSCFN
jgi:hypothetical protein